MNEEQTNNSQIQESGENKKGGEQFPKVELPAKTSSAPQKPQEYRGRMVSLTEIQEKEEERPAEDVNELVSLYERTVMDFKEGEIVRGKIIAVGDKEVAVDIGFKSEGTVPTEEFENPDELNIGDDIEVYLDRVENAEGQLTLSKKKADFLKIWERIGEIYQKGEIIQGKIMRRIKGGMVVDVLGVDAFFPGSQIVLHTVSVFDALVGQTKDFRIVKFN